MKIVIVETDVKVDKSFVASLRKLIQWYGEENIILDTGDWKKCLKFHGYDHGYDIEEGEKIVLIQDNVVIHDNAKVVIDAVIPTKGSIDEFVHKEDDANGPEVNEVVRKTNEKNKPIADAITENNYAYLNCANNWWDDEPNSPFVTSYVAFNHGDTTELDVGDILEHIGDSPRMFYKEHFKGIIWPVKTGSIVEIDNDHGKEDQWKRVARKAFPDDFNPRDSFTTSLDYSLEMHKPFFSLEEGLHQHVSMVFFHDFSIVDGMPL